MTGGEVSKKYCWFVEVYTESERLWLVCGSGQSRQKLCKSPPEGLVEHFSCTHVDLFVLVVPAHGLIKSE